MSYIGNRPENDAVINHIEYLATAGQTLFPVVYDSYVEVYLNGVRLAEDDFVKNNNVSISLVVGATAGDIVAVSGYQKVRSDSIASTDNAIARFDGINGTLQNSGITISDVNEVIFPSGGKIRGDFSNATVSNRTLFQTSTLNDRTTLTAIPNGTNTQSTFQFFNSSDTLNSFSGAISCSSVAFFINTSVSGTGVGLPFRILSQGGGAGVTFNGHSDKNFLIDGGGSLGYGTGSGAQVTQTINKGNTVVLNKSCGQIITNSASIAAGGYAYFTLSNSLITANDIVLVELSAANGVSDPSYYEISSFYVTAGSVRIKMKNVSGGALAEALAINFALIKGAIA